MKRAKSGLAHSTLHNTRGKPGDKRVLLRTTLTPRSTLQPTMQTALRASRVVRKQLSADPFEYHAKSSGFWDKVRKAVVVNPCVSIPLTGAAGAASDGCPPLALTDPLSNSTATRRPVTRSRSRTVSPNPPRDPSGSRSRRPRRPTSPRTPTSAATRGATTPRPRSSPSPNSQSS